MKYIDGGNFAYFFFLGRSSSEQVGTIRKHQKKRNHRGTFSEAMWQPGPDMREA